MKILVLSALLVSFSGFAEQDKKSENSVEQIVKKSKKERKKKAEMCHECGKPEEQCDCKGEGHRKKD